MSATCKICSIKLIKSDSSELIGKPADSSMPCNLDGCPYDHLEYKIVAAAKSRALTHKFLKKRKKR